MNPKTRPFDEPLEMDNEVLPVKIEAKESSSVSSTVDNSKRVNDHLPYIWFNGVLAALALGLSIGACVIAYIKADTVDGKSEARAEAISSKVDAIRDRATVSENHWRNIETEQGIQRADITRLQELTNAKEQRR